jgi:hypothetical protein
MWRGTVTAAALADRRAPDGRRNLRARARIKGRTSEASSAAMIRSAVLLLGCCLSLGVVAQARVAPATTGSTTQTVAPASDPARQALDAWLAAFNANDRKQLEAFRSRYQPTMDVDDMLEFFQRTGGFRLLRREPSAIGSAQALLQEHA